MWGVWVNIKFCSYDVFIELGHRLLYKCFGVHIFTLMKIIDILKLHEIPWVQENSEPVVVFCGILSRSSRTLASSSFTRYCILECTSSKFLRRFSMSCKLPLSSTIVSRCFDTCSLASSPHNHLNNLPFDKGNNLPGYYHEYLACFHRYTQLQVYCQAVTYMSGLGMQIGSKPV